LQNDSSGNVTDANFTAADLAPINGFDLNLVRPDGGN
jgi:hypothetical protein